MSARNEDEWFRIPQDKIIDQLAPGLVVEATAEDGQCGRIQELRPRRDFHPEYWAERDAPSLAILQAFGEAVGRYADSRGRSRPLERANA
jgi:gamma-glutamyl-gamma-aminobutyrate hydrolase PuuD